MQDSQLAANGPQRGPSQPANQVAKTALTTRLS